MSFASEASKLLTNKYFLYFISFLAFTNVIGYLVTNKINAVIFFALICILMINFSKNMVVVLIVAIIATNLLMVNKSMREGFKEGVDETLEETTDTTTTTTDAPTTTDATTTDATTTDATTAAQNKVTAAKDMVTTAKNTRAASGKPTISELKTAAKNKVASTTGTTGTTGTTTTTTTTDVEEPEPEIESFSPAGAGFNGKKRGAIGGPAKASRIDYSTTLEQAYDNLDKMLSNDGLSNLSADTEKLMNQQQKLFSAVNKMMPMMESAQGMINGLDMDKIGSLIGMTEKFGNIGSMFGGAK
jgi:hypothetical protein